MPGTRFDSKRRLGFALRVQPRLRQLMRTPRRFARCHPFPLYLTCLATICARRPAGIKLWPPPLHGCDRLCPIDERETITDVTRSIWKLVLSNVAVRPRPCKNGERLAVQGTGAAVPTHHGCRDAESSCCAPAVAELLWRSGRRRSTGIAGEEGLSRPMLALRQSFR